MKLRKFILNWILFNLTEARKLYARRRFSEQGVSSRACDSHSVCVASQSNLCERWEGWKNQNEDDNLLARWPQVKLIYFTWRGRNVAYNFMRSGALRSSPAHSNEVLRIPNCMYFGITQGVGRMTMNHAYNLVYFWPRALATEQFLTGRGHNLQIVCSKFADICLWQIIYPENRCCTRNEMRY